MSLGETVALDLEDDEMSEIQDLTMTEADAQRFWAKVDRSAGVAPAACWPWLAGVVHGRGGGEYGRLWLRGRKVRAHRVAYAAEYSEIPPGMKIDHVDCASTLCVRPSHLRALTNKANQENRRGPGGAQVNGTSGYRGVFWETRHAKWRAVVRHHRQQIHLGLFVEVLEAAETARIARTIIFTASDDPEIVDGVTPERSEALRASVVARLTARGVLPDLGEAVGG